MAEADGFSRIHIGIIHLGLIRELGRGWDWTLDRECFVDGLIDKRDFQPTLTAYCKRCSLLLREVQPPDRVK